MAEDREERKKFYARKRTKSGRYITIAQGDTRQELIEEIKSDSETYREERGRHGKETYRHRTVRPAVVPETSPDI